MIKINKQEREKTFFSNPNKDTLLKRVSKMEMDWGQMDSSGGILIFYRSCGVIIYIFIIAPKSKQYLIIRTLKKYNSVELL